jgi:hypothetical protein
MRELRRGKFWRFLPHPVGAHAAVTGGEERDDRLFDFLPERELAGDGGELTLPEQAPAPADTHIGRWAASRSTRRERAVSGEDKRSRAATPCGSTNDASFFARQREVFKDRAIHCGAARAR